jgi:sialate O-acetylesterase
MPAIFGDHMVLQQGTTLPVWGSAAPGERVSVSFADRHGETVADATGRWRVTLRPIP